MDLKGEYRIGARREMVWGMINDPEVLKDCIPGCESLEGNPQDGFSARVTTRIGPIKATFVGAVKLTDIQAPERYTISGEGKGGVAGFAKGGADVTLAEDGNGTVLTYVARAQVGGKLAQLGARLIDSTAKKLADEFFRNLAERISASTASAGAAEGPEPALVSPRAPSAVADPTPAAASPARTSTTLWIVAAAVAVAAIALAVLR